MLHLRRLHIAIVAALRGKIAKFYKLNDTTGEYEWYVDVQQLNNNASYGKTYFSEGSYKVFRDERYVEFDEWFVTDD